MKKIEQSNENYIKSLYTEEALPKDKSKLTHEQIYLNIFKESKNKYSKSDLDLDFDLNLGSGSSNDYSQSFYSNILFLDYLCNITNQINTIQDHAERLKFLICEIGSLNKSIPGNVYVPFVSESLRNYFIVNIPLSELKVFKTKTKAPCFITFELVRLDELNQHMLRYKKPIKINEINDKLELKGLNKLESESSLSQSLIINKRLSFDEFTNRNTKLGKEEFSYI